MPASAATPTPHNEQLPRELMLVIGLLLLGAFVMILNETVMSVAISTLMVDFAISAATAQWLTTAFLLTMAVVIPLTGVLLQRFSTRTVFLVATGLFTAGTVVCAAAPVFALLLVGRVIQASGTALMLPLLTTTVLTLVPRSRRGRIMGLISIVIAVAPAIGPTFSGLILNALSWQWMFLTLLPFAVLTLVVGAILVKDVSMRKHTRFDVLSVLLSAVAFGGLVYGSSSISEALAGSGLLFAVVPIGVGALALVLFVLRQLSLQRSDAALLDLRTFNVPVFAFGTVMLMVAMATLFGVLILLPIYLQDVMGLDTLETGLIVLPGGLAMGLVAPFVGRAFDRWGPRPLLIPGSVMFAIALGALCLLTPTTPIPVIIATHLTMSLGFGFLMTPLMTSTLGSLDNSLYSHGSAIVNTLQQLAGAAGTALFVTVMTVSSAATTTRSEVDSLATGIHQAFVCGGVLTLVTVALSCTIRRPPATPI